MTRTLNILALIALIATSALSIVGCTKKEAPIADGKGPNPAAEPAAKAEAAHYGAPIEGTATPLADLLKDPAPFEGQTVVLEGTLGQVCQDMGCWFMLHDPADTSAKPADLYIDLQMGAVFTIPKDSAGKHGVVMGRVEKNGATWKVIAKGVDLS